MKIGDNKYKCGFCGTIVKQQVNKVLGHGKKGRATDQVGCPKCGNLISQKSKYD